MNTVQLFLLAYLTGLTVAGLFSAVAEALTRQPVGFREPFVSQDSILASLAVTGLGGPAMLLNDTLAAWHAGAFSSAGLAGVVALVNAWALALGIVTMEAVSALVF
ncbi:MAG: hypothetical protein KDJ73_08780 [Notoacmeibacter sp.]|nr:hypothetical protein [Notoacmeibacter sp.]MCC0031750.1 hypothetical protein [Brucellaceae bacterium]